MSLRLVNGVFGDPLLLVEMRNVRGRLLFDLGEGTQLSRRVLHTVNDVFITHAHFDHICGFLTLLRARMTGRYPPCRLFGPPGLAGHVAGFLAGICWDRIEDLGPVFDVAEVHASYVSWRRLQAGREAVRLADQPRPDATVARTSGYRVSAVTLDHGVPVLAYALELAPEHHLREDALAAFDLTPGPWIRELKRLLQNGAADGLIDLGTGRRERAASLQARVLTTVPGPRLVYATDFADTVVNRRAVADLAGGADLLLCESCFRQTDRDQAAATQHLTTDACAAIAAAAGVKRLVPIHFSKRYSRDVAPVYAELRAALGSV
ncbi:MAG: MBL fold metallo-hydrolase [Pseudomonadales bacterium]